MHVLKYKNYILEFIFFCLLMIIIYFKLELKYLTGILLCFTSIVCIIVRKKNNLYINKKQAGKVLILFGLVYVILLYFIGIFTGFYKSYYPLSINNFFYLIFPLSICIICLEILRSKFLTVSSKINKIFCIIPFILSDYILFASFYNLRVFNDFRDAVFIVVLSSISSNILYNYTSFRFGYKYNIIYRFITTLYQYIIPIIPDIYDIFNSIIRVLYPCIVCYTISSYYEINYVPTIKKNRYKKITFVFLIITILMFLGVVSGKFTYGALVVGSGSMSGVIDKGDVVLYKRVKKSDNIEKGDIIIFKNENNLIVHRIISIKDVNGEMRIYTKGDANELEDEGYRTEDMIVGKVYNKVKYIGIFSIKIRELFERKV